MHKKNLRNIKLPENIDRVIEEAINMAENEKNYNKQHNKKNYKNTYRRIVAGVTLVIGLSIGSTVLALNIPAIKSVFEKIQDRLYSYGDYSNYATKINESVYNNGVSVTLSEVLCDGENLYVTYLVKSDEAFKLYNTEVEHSQLIDVSQSRVSFTDIELDDSGIAGFEGRFIDDHTFIGVEEYNLHELRSIIPNNFEFSINIKEFRNSYHKSETTEEQVFKGSWNFKVPVTIDRSITSIKEVNDINKYGLGVETISITPFKIYIETIHPEGFKRYNIKVKNEKGEVLGANSGNWYDDYFISVIDKQNITPKQLTIELTRDIVQENTTGYKVSGEEIIYSTVVNLN